MVKKCEELESLLQAGFRYGLALTHDHHDAEDLLQQAVYRLSSKYGQIENRTVLYRTMRNLFIDQQRRKKVVAFEALEDEAVVIEGSVNESGGDMESILGTLRDNEREALFLNAVEGYTAQEISDATGSPRGSILSLIHRAKEKVRRHLSGEFKRKEAES